MEIDQRIVLGVALVALLISIFSYKEILDMRCLITGGTPTPEPMIPPVHERVEETQASQEEENEEY
tara:strand:+ start:217 stop:414 length:198 start_codon:yes stop_codon:yes gene_type:complete